LRGNDTFYGLGGNNTITYVESAYRLIGYMNETYISIPDYYELDTINLI